MLVRASQLAVGLAAFATSVSSTPIANNDEPVKDKCNNLWQSAPASLADLTVNLAEYVPAGTTINETANGAYIAIGRDVGPFCRFSANITTSEMSSVRFEVWLPDADKWNGNHLFVGNGGVGGYVRYENMQVPLAKYGFAVASTNTGHDGSSGDGTFAVNNPESQIDFGYRAVHLSTVYSKKIIDLYYGKKPELAYWFGCSSGGKQGLKELQMYPEDYDAALVGAPAWDWARLNGWTAYVNLIVNPLNTTRFIPPSAWSAISAEVYAQCDELDGLKDGIITEPGKCFLDYDRFRCGGGSSMLNSTTCLVDAQIPTLRGVYANWTDPTTGELIFPAFNIGSEYAFAFTINGVPYGPAPSYFNYQVLNVSEVLLPIESPPLLIDGQPVTESQLIELVRKGEATDPGMTIADNYDLSPFFKRGGKLIHYVGGVDTLIPTNTSQVYYESVQKKLGDVSKSYLFYEVAGMGHCSGGPGAWNVGLAGQLVQASGVNTGQSSKFDAKHDALLALRAWRERGQKPGALIGAAYVQNNISQGVAFERPVCVWPKQPAYKGGDETKASSFECE